MEVTKNFPTIKKQLLNLKWKDSQDRQIINKAAVNNIFALN